MVVDDRSAPLNSCSLRIHPPLPNKVGPLPPNPKEVVAEEFSAVTVPEMLGQVRAAVARPLAVWERWTRFREVVGEIQLPIATVAFHTPPEDGLVAQACAEAWPAYVQAVTVGAKIRFSMRFFLPGPVAPEVGEAFPTPEDVPVDETESWTVLHLPGLQLRYTVDAGPELPPSRISEWANAPEDERASSAGTTMGIAVPKLSKTLDAGNPAPAAEPFWRAVQEYAERLSSECATWDVLHVVVAMTDHLRTLQRPDMFVPPRFDSLGHPLVASRLYSTAGVRRPGLDAIGAVNAGAGCAELGGIGRLTAYGDVGGAAMGSPSLWPVMMQRGLTTCQACGARDVKEVRFSKLMSELSVLCAGCALLPNPNMPEPVRRPTGSTASFCTPVGTASTWSSMRGPWRDAGGPSPPPTRGGLARPKSPARSVPGDATVPVALCFQLGFGPDAMEGEPMKVEHEGKKKHANVVDEDPELQWVTAVGYVLVSRPRLQQELAVAMHLPTSEVVVGPLMLDGSVNVCILDRQVAASLFGAKHIAAVKGLREALRTQGLPDTEPSVGDLNESLGRLREQLSETRSPVHVPPTKSTGQLRLCLSAREARGDDISAASGQRLDLSGAWDFAEHVVVADLASGRQDSADRLICSEVACSRGCGRIFPRHDGTLEKHERLLCPKRQIPCASCRSIVTVADLVDPVDGGNRCRACAS